MSSPSHNPKPSSSSSNKPKPVRRRCKTALSSLSNYLSAHQVRREIFHALQHHRSSRSSSSSSSSSSCDVVVGPLSQFNSLVNAMPLPGPVWSTTPPSVVAYHDHQPFSEEAANDDMEELDGFEWAESSQASSYSWWLAFLKILDANKCNNGDEKENVDKSTKCALPALSLGMSSNSNWLFGQTQMMTTSCKVGHDHVDAEDHCPSPDEWLMFPATQDHDHHEGEIVIQ